MGDVFTPTGDDWDEFVHLDTHPGNANGPAAEAAMRALSTEPLVSRTVVFFSHYMEAPRIVDWLAAEGVAARFEQRANEGVTIVVGNQRAYVGDHILTVGTWSSVLTSRG